MNRMRLRDLVTNLIFLALAVVHFSLQWYGWKMHLQQVEAGGALLGGSGDQLWTILSFPLFVVLPRRLQNLYFLEMLVANSALWGITLSWGIALPHRLLTRGKAKARLVTGSEAAEASPATPRTGTDRLVELKRLKDEGLITREEYQRKREIILLDI
jgi:hypothetical protein